MERMLIEKPQNAARTYLQGYRWALLRRDALREEIARGYEAATRATGRIEAVRTSGTPYRDGMANAVCRVVDAKARLEDAAREIDAALARVLLAVNVPQDERQKTLLTLRYINGLSWEDIQDRIGYERTQTLLLHGRALAAVNRWLEAQAEMAAG